MNVYKLGYYSYEDSEYLYLLHDKVFTEAEFQSLVVEAAKSVAPSLIKDALEKDSGKLRYVNHAVKLDSIHRDIARELVTSHGFSDLKVTTEAVWFGWEHLDSKEIWNPEGKSPMNLALHSALAPELDNVGFYDREPDNHND